MKKYLLISAVFIFLATILNCGGEEDCREATSTKEGYKCDTESGFWEKEKEENGDNNGNNQNNGENNGDNDSNNENGDKICQYGTYKCQYDDSYYCGYYEEDLTWLISQRCDYGCNESTGQCYPNPNFNDDDEYVDDNEYADEDNSECTPGDFKCAGAESHYCNTYGTWVYDARCDYGCDESTGKCKTYQECSAGDYKCEDSYIYSCSNNHWKSDKYCQYGCYSQDSETYTCKECESGQYRCSGSESQYCKNGFWQTNSQCDTSYGCNYSTGKCNQCKPGEYRCYLNSSFYYTDSSYYCDNGIENPTTCEGRCDPSTGKCKTYSNGNYYCEGKTSYYYTNNEFQGNETCSNYGCDESTGKCRTSCPTIAGKMWSKPTTSTNCESLSDCGYNDWRAPTIGELRTLIQYCPATQTGGSCKVSNSCLSGSCWTSDCESCSSISYGLYSKLGDSSQYCSSSVDSNNTDYRWCINFSTAAIKSVQTTSGTTRCVR